MGGILKHCTYTELLRKSPSEADPLNGCKDADSLFHLNMHIRADTEISVKGEVLACNDYIFKI